MSHTKGPWEVLRGKDATGSETLCIRGSGEFIATMDVVAIGNGPYGMPSNCFENAKLIASSPILLEGLRLIAECPDMGEIPTYMKQVARAAISIAEGK